MAEIRKFCLQNPPTITEKSAKFILDVILNARKSKTTKG